MNESINTSGFTRNSVVRKLKGEGVEFFLNTDLEPTVHIPQDGFRKDWPADSQRVQDLVVSVYYELSGEQILKPSEREILMSLIREDCRKGGRRLSDSESEKTENDVYLQAILYLMNLHPIYEDKTSVLLGLLSSIQEQRKISRAEEISVFTNVFSRRLGRLIPILKGYGLDVSFSHTEFGSQCRIVRLESFQREQEAFTALPKQPDGSALRSSVESSVANALKGASFKQADATDGDIRFDTVEDKAALQAWQGELINANSNTECVNAATAAETGGAT